MQLGRGADMDSHEQIQALTHQMADAVRNLYGIEGPIAHIDDIVRMIGGNVVEDSSLQSFADGKIRKSGRESFEIIISPCQGEGRKNWVIARALGHLFLHMGYKSDQERWDAQGQMVPYRCGKVELERQANAFAAAFLMPEKDYRRVMEQYTDSNMVDTAAVARYFHVSISAAADRGRGLGYLRW